MKQTIDWHQYWTRETPGFHEGRVNRYLERYLDDFDLAPSARIFLPLCGKAHDIHWLWRRGYEVVGVELSRVAVESFLAEFAIRHEVTRDGQLTRYSAPGLTLYQGDLMHLSPGHLQDCKLIYDRAALVAIESFNRAAYVAHLQQLMPVMPPTLLITLDYDQGKMSGPPFSVPVTEIESLYAGRYRIEELERCEQIDERPKWRQLGLRSLQEIALRLTPR